MSALTDLIAEAVANADKPCRKALAANPGKGCTVMGYDHCLCLASARAAAAVVADWLESDEVRALAADAIFTEHEPAYHAQETRTKLRGVLERQFGETAAAATAALAAEARKGAGQ